MIKRLVAPWLKSKNTKIGSMTLKDLQACSSRNVSVKAYEIKVLTLIDTKKEHF